MLGLEIQGSTEPLPFFSFLTDAFAAPYNMTSPFRGDHDWEDVRNVYDQAPSRLRPCYGTATTTVTHKLVRDALDKLPTFSVGKDGRGNSPRYCPSIETKVRRFPDRPHHVWLEPEGLDTTVMYPQGLSTGMPEDIQLRMMRTIPGLENVEILRPG